MMKLKVASRRLRSSFASILLAHPLTSIQAVTSQPARKGSLLFGSGFKYIPCFSDCVYLVGAGSSNFMREKSPLGMPCRHFSSYNEKLQQFAELKALPSPPAFDLYSQEGDRLLLEAEKEGTPKHFISFLLSYQFMSEPGFYGLASIANVLNALEVSPGSKWKSHERWCYEYLLDCCDSLENVRANGLTFGKLAFLAHCNGADVEVFHTNQCTISDFRKHVMKCATLTDSYLITFFDRKHLKQSGAGHISPIGGYHAGRDMVLIMDVARFEYPPHWIPLTLLWEAMNTIDEVTGNRKGFMVLSRLPYDPSIHYTMSCRDESWISTARYLKQVPLHLKSDDIKDLQQVLSVLFRSRSTNSGKLIKKVVELNGRANGASSMRLTIQADLSRQVQETELYRHVCNWLKSSYCGPEIAVNICCQGIEKSPRNPGSSEASDDMHTSIVSMPVVSCTNEQEAGAIGSDSSYGIEKHLASADILTMLLFALPPHTWSGIKEAKLATEIKNLVSVEDTYPLLNDEVLSLRQQLQFLMMDVSLPPS